MQPSLVAGRERQRTYCTDDRTSGASYRAAWTMPQRYRVATVRVERERLSGNLGIDKTLVGSVENGGKRGHGTSKCIVVIAAEVRPPKGFRQVRTLVLRQKTAQPLYIDRPRQATKT